MGEIIETEQWLLKGECKKCRRQSYCRKPCGAVKREFRSGVKQAIASALKEKMGGKMKNNEE